MFDFPDRQKSKQGIFRVNIPFHGTYLFEEKGKFPYVICSVKMPARKIDISHDKLLGTLAILKKKLVFD